MSEVQLPSHPCPQPILTLAIPTFNRDSCLASLLEGVFRQLAAEPRIELLISDNCSTDDTSNVLDSFRARGLRFRYIRNSVNLGPDANFLQCFNESKGKYLWLIGDDDVLAPGAITKILSLLEKGEGSSSGPREDFDLIYLSTFAVLGDYDPGVATNSQNPFVRCAELICDGNYFLKRVNALISLISSVIVNKNRLIADGHFPIRNLENSSLAQLAWVLPVLREKARIVYVWERLMGYRLYSSRGWGPCQVFGVNLQRIAADYFIYAPRLRENLMNSVLRYWLPTVILDMRRGRHPAMLFEECSKILSPVFRNNWRYWLFVYPMASWPLWLARSLHRCITLLNRITRVRQLFFRHLFGRVQSLSYN